MSVSRGKAKKRIVKHSKKAWRVTDVKDVEHFLEEERLEERLGDPFETRPDESLFVIDNEEKPKDAESSQPKKAKRGTSPLRCFQILETRTAVKDPLVKRNSVKLRSKKFPKKPRTLEDPVTIKASGVKETKTQYDLWSDGSELERKKHVLKIQAADLFPGVKRHLLESTCDRIMDQPKHRLYKPSKLPAVEAPLPGQSYNPTYADHQNLLLQAHLVEAAKEEKSVKVKRKAGNIASNVAAMPTEDQWLSEMSQGLAEDGDSGILEDEMPESESSLTKGQVKPKTRKQRRKEKQRRMAVLKALDSKEKALKEHDVFRLKSIRKEITEHEKSVQKAAEKRQKKKELRAFQPLVLGPNKFTPQDMELNLSEEISGSLRKVHTDGDLIVDRFKSLQRRNLIEPRKMQIPKRKYKLKKFVKKGHKMEN